MQSASSRIWTCVTMSISYSDNRYTTGTSNYVYMCVYVYACLHVCISECECVFVCEYLLKISPISRRRLEVNFKAEYI